MYLYIPLAFIIIAGIIIALFLWRYHRLPMESIIRAAQAETISRELDIEVSTWFGRSQLQFSLKPKNAPSAPVGIVPEMVPAERLNPMMSAPCDACQEFMLIEPPRFKGKMQIRESRFTYLNMGHGWDRFEKIAISAPCGGRVEYPVVTELDKKHWWFRIVTTNDVLFTIIRQNGEKQQVKPEGTSHLYSFQVLPSTEVDTDDIVMVIMRESSEPAR